MMFIFEVVGSPIPFGKYPTAGHIWHHFAFRLYWCYAAMLGAVEVRHTTQKNDVRKNFLFPNEK